MLSVVSPCGKPFAIAYATETAQNIDQANGKQKKRGLPQWPCLSERGNSRQPKAGKIDHMNVQAVVDWSWQSQPEDHCRQGPKKRKSRPKKGWD
jgi:hypothetical protein